MTKTADERTYVLVSELVAVIDSWAIGRTSYARNDVKNTLFGDKQFIYAVTLTN